MFQQQNSNILLVNYATIWYNHTTQIHRHNGLHIYSTTRTLKQLQKNANVLKAGMIVSTRRRLVHG